MRVHKQSKLRNSNAKMDARKIINKSKETKATYSFSLDQALMEEIKVRIGKKAKISRIIEELLREFLLSLEKEKQ